MFQRQKKEKIRNIPIRKIQSSPSALRRRFDPDSLSRLSESVQRFGILQPLLVRPAGDKFELLAGERRLRAARLCGAVSVPCRVLDVGPRQTVQFSLIENKMREDLTIFEEAQALDTLIKTFRFTQEEAGEMLGMSQSAVANKLRLLRFSPDERSLITECGLSERHARALLKVSDPDLRRFALGYLIQKDYGVRQAEAFISTLLEHPDEFMIPLKPLHREKPVRKSLVRDVRLFINSVDKAIYSIQEAGVHVEATKEDGDEYVSYTIRVPKYAAKSA